MSKQSYVNCEDFLQIITREEKKPFSIWKGELMRVFIIHHEKQTRLLLMAHHLVGDGMSLIYFAQDIMQALNSSAALPFKPLHLLTPDAAPLKDALPLPGNMVFLLPVL